VIGSRPAGDCSRGSDFAGRTGGRYAANNAAQVQRASTDANILYRWAGSNCHRWCGSGGGAHTLQEWFDSNGRELGVEADSADAARVGGSGGIMERVAAGAKARFLVRP